MSKFLPYQKRWILDESPIKLYEKSRRVGISYATSYRSSRKCLRSGKENSNFVQWVSSRDDITAREFITDYVAHWAREANRVARELAKGKTKIPVKSPQGELDILSDDDAQNFAEGWQGVIGLDGKCVEVVDEKNGITAHVVKFKNGSRIFSLSSNPRAFAGKGGDVLIDEWDLHPEQDIIYDMAFPCTMQGNQLELVSAYDPEGSESTEFAKLCAACKNGQKPEISFHTTNILQAVDDGYVEMINALRLAKGRPTQTREEFLAYIRSGCRTLDAYNSQFMCIPNKASGGQMIVPEDLTAAEKPIDVVWIQVEGMDDLERRSDLFSAEFWQTMFGNDYYALGWDIAATVDLTSIWANKVSFGQRDDAGASAMSRWGKPYHQLRFLITMHGCFRLSRQRDVVDAMMAASYNIVGCGDKTGLGLSDCTELEIKYNYDEKHPRFKGINFGASKMEIGTTMQAAYEQRRQEIPITPVAIGADVASIKKDKTPNKQRLTFVETVNEHLPASHSDIGWSNGLSIHAAETMFDSFGLSICEPIAESPTRHQSKEAQFWSSDRSHELESQQDSVWRYR